jgi:hypothetical protein
MPGAERGIETHGGAEQWKAAGRTGRREENNGRTKKRQDEEKAPRGLGPGGAWTGTGPSAVLG